MYRIFHPNLWTRLSESHYIKRVRGRSYGKLRKACKELSQNLNAYYCFRNISNKHFIPYRTKIADHIKNVNKSCDAKLIECSTQLLIQQMKHLPTTLRLSEVIKDDEGNLSTHLQKITENKELVQNIPIQYWEIKASIVNELIEDFFEGLKPGLFTRTKGWVSPKICKKHKAVIEGADYEMRKNFEEMSLHALLHLEREMKDKNSPQYKEMSNLQKKITKYLKNPDKELKKWKATHPGEDGE